MVHPWAIKPQHYSLRSQFLRQQHWKLFYSVKGSCYTFDIRKKGLEGCGAPIQEIICSKAFIFRQHWAHSEVILYNWIGCLTMAYQGTWWNRIYWEMTQPGRCSLEPGHAMLDDYCEQILSRILSQHDVGCDGAQWASPEWRFPWDIARPY